MRPVLAFVFWTTALAAEAALPIQNWTTSSGARVFFVASRANPMLDINVDFDAGGRRVTADKSGLAGLTRALLRAGTAARPEEEISRLIADVGAQLGGSADRDRAGLTLRTLSAERERTQALATFAEIMQAPAFPEAQLAREKARAVAAVKEEETKPDAIANKAFYRLLYGTHPYAFAPTPESIESVRRADVEAFYRRYYVAEQAVVTIIGDADRALAERIAEQLTSRLPRAGAAPEALSVVKRPPGEVMRIAHPASPPKLDAPA